MVSPNLFFSLGIHAIGLGLLSRLVWIVYKHRKRPNSLSFGILISALLIWTLFSFISTLSVVPPETGVSTVVSIGQFGMALLIPAIWLLYSFGYTGRGSGLTRGRAVIFSLAIIPILASILVFAIGLPESVVERIFAGMLGTEVLILFSMFVYATYLLVDLGGSHARVSNTQILIVVGGVSAPYLISVIGNNSSILTGSGLGLLFSGGLLTIAMDRYPVLSNFPKDESVARTRVVETLQEPVIILDWDNHILDHNEKAAELFDTSNESIIGRPVESVIDGIDDVGFGSGESETLPIQTTTGRRQFHYSVSPVEEGRTGANPVARTVLFQDVTDRQTREQRLSVLNRILRHNVRNELDILLAYANGIESGEVQSKVRDSAQTLLELSQKARAAEEMMAESSTVPDQFDVVAEVTDVVSEYQTTTDQVEISLDCPPHLELCAHRSIVRQMVSELIENSLDHLESTESRIAITLRGSDDSPVEIAVSDTGSGIPEHELEILTSGTESQLEHGTGIGLWFVNWAVTQLGGEIEFEHNDPAGTTVRIRLANVECN